MKARLKTKCGCTKEIETTFPPPDSIVQQLRTPEPPVGDWGRGPELYPTIQKYRTFRLDLSIRYTPLSSIAFYIEE